jgi:hypothetical protein
MKHLSPHRPLRFVMGLAFLVNLGVPCADAQERLKPPRPVDEPNDPSAIQRIDEIDSFGCQDPNQQSKIWTMSFLEGGWDRDDSAIRRNRRERVAAAGPTCRLWNRGEQVKIIEREEKMPFRRCLAPYPDGGPCFWTYPGNLEHPRETGNPHP